VQAGDAVTIIIGVDPGTIRMGVGVIRADGKRMEFVRGELLEAPKSWGLASRLNELNQDLIGICDELLVKGAPVGTFVLCGLEEGFRGGMGDLSLAEARGVARVTLARSFGEKNLRGYAPSTIKKAVTGNGGSTKDSVAFAVKHTLRMKVAPQADIADALAVAITRAMDKE
jgi:crossover junction endodeoxyribonuclease RuvC